MNRFINKEIYYSISLILVPLIIIFSFYFYSNLPSPRNVDRNELASQTIEYTYVKNIFEDIGLEAKSVIVENLQTGEILYEKNSTIAAPIASITKIMTALVLYENVENLEIDVVIPIEAFSVYGNTQLRLNEMFSLKDLIDLMLLTSSNHAAVAVSKNFENLFPEMNFIDEMNNMAKQIGMENTYFLNETGLDENIYTAGSFSSAKDISKLMKYGLKNYPELFEKTTLINYSVTSKTGFLHTIYNTNTAIRNLPTILASKTGFTDLAGGNLAVVLDPGLNTPISIVVLGSTREGRFVDVLKLADKVYNK